MLHGRISNMVPMTQQPHIAKNMDACARQAVTRIHASPTKAVVYVSGGASKALSWLLSEAGASNTILQATVPYSTSSFDHILGVHHNITSYASMEAARQLAHAAYVHAVRLALPGDRVIGIAAACSLISTQPKRGEHRAFVVAHASERIVEYAIHLNKHCNRNRIDEDDVSSLLVLQALSDDCCSCDQSFSISRESTMCLLREYLKAGDVLSPPKLYHFPDIIKSVIKGNTQYVEKQKNTWNRDANQSTIIYPGSFNPLHAGHKTLMNLVKCKFPKQSTAYEISIVNADKASIFDEKQVRKRIAQFSDADGGVIISRGALFLDKAKLYGSVRFIVGVDTVFRILNPKYYSGDIGGVIDALTQLKIRGCSFIVAGRVEQHKTDTTKHFQTLKNVSIPKGFENMFEQINECDFRMDISSSEIRSQQYGNT